MRKERTPVAREPRKGTFRMPHARVRVRAGGVVVERGLRGSESPLRGAGRHPTAYSPLRRRQGRCSAPRGTRVTRRSMPAPAVLDDERKTCPCAWLSGLRMRRLRIWTVCRPGVRRTPQTIHVALPRIMGLRAGLRPVNCGGQYSDPDPPNDSAK